MVADEEVTSFVQGWVARNVRGIGGLNVVLEVERLAARLTGDARAAGISGRAIHKVLGDIDDYLTGQYSQSCREKATHSSHDIAQDTLSAREVGVGLE